MTFDGYDIGGFHDEMFLPDGSPLAVADRHVAVAAAADPCDAAPVTGTFREHDATAHLEADVELHAAPAPTT